MSPVGRLLLGALDDNLCLCDWLDTGHVRHSLHRIELNIGSVDIRECETQLLEEASHVLDEYFAGKRRILNLPILTFGTDFQRDVWKAIEGINYGATVSYSELAMMAGHGHAVRAVASAVGANALSVFIPCHRIVAVGGAIGGYAGGLEAKRGLLTLEAR